MSEYKDALISSMAMLASNPKTVFLGYGITKPDSAGLKAGAAGSLVGVPMSQRREMPTNENLMAGVAIGLSLMGYIPVIYFERFDFVLNALDQIVNHADKLDVMSNGQYQPAVIYRVVAANRDKPLFSSLTHTGNYTKAMREMVDFLVLELESPDDVVCGYERAFYRAANSKGSTMLIEHKSKW